MSIGWPLILRHGFGHVLPRGRWDHDSTELIAEALNSGDWTHVIEWAEVIDWDPAEAD